MGFITPEAYENVKAAFPSLDDDSVMGIASQLCDDGMENVKSVKSVKEAVQRIGCSIPVKEQTNDFVKQVIFGNQKQGDVINTAVAEDIEIWLKDINDEADCSSLQSTVSSIQVALTRVISYCQSGAVDLNHNLPSRNFVRYVTGVKAYELLKQTRGDNLVASVMQPNPESPKHCFTLSKNDEAPEYEGVGDFETQSGSVISWQKSEGENIFKDAVEKAIINYCQLPESASYQSRVEDTFTRFCNIAGLCEDLEEQEVSDYITFMKDQCPTAAIAELDSDVERVLYACLALYNDTGASSDVDRSL